MAKGLMGTVAWKPTHRTACARSGHIRAPLIDRDSRGPTNAPARKRSRGASLHLTAMYVLSLSILLTISLIPASPAPDTREATPPARILLLTPHDPIYIDGDDGFTNASGVVWGSGSESDPYIISDWDINVTSTEGIMIRFVSAHFVVKGCYIHDGEVIGRTGIFVDQCDNGTIRDNQCVRNLYGVYVMNHSCDNRILNNTCSNNAYDGIELIDQCERNEIVNNTFIDNLDGIHLESSGHNVVRNNVILRGGLTMLGQSLTDCTTNDIDTSNTVNGKPVYLFRNQSGGSIPSDAGGIILANCTDFVIEDRHLDYAHAPIEILFSSNITVRGNTLTNNSYGILLWRSDNNTLTKNAISNDRSNLDDWWAGIGLFYSKGNIICDNLITDTIDGVVLRYSSHDNELCNNRIQNNSYGLYLSDSGRNEILQNRIDNNTHYAFLVLSGPRNIIWNNTIRYNNGAGDSFDASHVQALDFVGTGTLWNSSGGVGNYWSDWTSPDADGDGIVDSPYPISNVSGVRDFFPLANPPAEPIPEFNSLPLVIVAILLAMAIWRVGRGKRLSAS